MDTFTVQGIQIPDVKEKEKPDVELGEPFEEVENLVWIKSNTVYKEALKEWERKATFLGDKVDRREKRVEDLTNQVYNLVGFFSVFQGVVLTAVTQLTQSWQPHRPLCGKVWFPVVLSGLAAIATIVGISLKFSHLYELDKLIQSEKLAQREATKRERKLRQGGESFKFSSLQDPPSREQESYWLLKYFAVIGALILFTVIFVVSYFVILCDKWVIRGWH